MFKGQWVDWNMLKNTLIFLFAKSAYSTSFPFFFELLSNQSYESMETSSIFKLIRVLKPSFAWLVAIWVRWQRHSATNLFGFFGTKRDQTELRQSFVLVLFADKLMQFDHGMSYSAYFLTMESTILYALGSVFATS